MKTASETFRIIQNKSFAAIISAAMAAALMAGCASGTGNNNSDETQEAAVSDEVSAAENENPTKEDVPDKVTWEAVEAGTVNDDTAMEIVSAAVDAQIEKEAAEGTQQDAQPESSAATESQNQEEQADSEIQAEAATSGENVPNESGQDAPSGIDILQFALDNMDSAAVAEGAELQLQYPFEGDGGNAGIDWNTMVSQYPGLSFVLSAPAAGIEAPVIAAGAGSTVAGTASVNEDINSGYFIPKLIVRDDDSDMLGNIRVFGDEEFLKANPYIYLYTGNTTYEYRVFASFTESAETAIEPADFDTEIGLSNYIDAVYQQKSMDAVLDMEQIQRIYAEHQILAIQLPNSDGTMFDVQAVITGRMMK